MITETTICTCIHHSWPHVHVALSVLTKSISWVPEDQNYSWNQSDIATAIFEIHFLRHSSSSVASAPADVWASRCWLVSCTVSVAVHPVVWGRCMWHAMCPLAGERWRQTSFPILLAFQLDCRHRNLAWKKMYVHIYTVHVGPERTHVI